MSSQPTKDDRSAPLAVVCWHDVAGVPIRAYPLPRPLAEAVARAFTATYPRETFWVEDIPWLEPTGPAVRVAGHRRAALPLAASAGKRPTSVAP